MKRSLRKCQWGLGALFAGLAALSATWAGQADVLDAVQVLREGGCGGILPAARPVRHNALLDQTAERWAAGQSLSAAAEHSGYRAQSTAGLRISGPDSYMVQQLRRSSCRTVASQDVREIGIYRRGRDTWIVLASAYPVSVGPPASSTKPAQPPPTRAQSPAPVLASPSVLATRALLLVNDVRARGTHCGERSLAPAPPVTLSWTLVDVASGHATDMAEHNYFEHEDLAGHSPADRVRSVGYREKLVGENIAYGPKSVEEVVQGWLDSPGHCENIMDPRFAEMGLGYAVGHVSRRGLYWVQLMAAPRSVKTPDTLSAQRTVQATLTKENR